MAIEDMAHKLKNIMHARNKIHLHVIGKNTALWKPFQNKETIVLGRDCIF